MSSKLLLLLCILCFTKPIYSEIPYSTGTDRTIALQGADSVAYFTENKYMKGSNTFQLIYHGVAWLFTNQNHLNQFKNNPEQFIPQYHGYAAYEMANGEQAESLPNLWCIYQNKLYLNHSAKTHKIWLKNKGSYISNSDKNWKKMIAPTQSESTQKPQ